MIINKLLHRLSKSLREIYYIIFPDYDLLSNLENNLALKLNIETSNICNANCVFCGYQYQKRNKLIMSKELFLQIIDDYNSIGGGNLGLGSPTVGDPLIDPYLVDRIKYARKLTNIRNIDITTNCINLHKIGAYNLLASGVTDITISTTGFDLDVHEKIYRSNKANMMKYNLIDLLKTNNYLRKPCKITIALRTYQSMRKVISDPEFNEISELAHSVTYNYFYDDWSGRIKPETLPKGLNIRPGGMSPLKKMIPCSMLYGRMTILSNGNVSMCGCRDLNGDSELIVGNIKDNSLLTTYRSKKVIELREQWLKHKKVPNICKDCLHYSAFTYLMLKEVRIKNNLKSEPGCRKTPASGRKNSPGKNMEND
jgi:radical SAM protein with 4Fe4S-binding SPASM domain